MGEFEVKEPFLDLRWGYFGEGEPHPSGCDCHPGEHRVVHRGGVCFIANVGTWSDLKRLDVDWDRQQRLAELWSPERIAEQRRVRLKIRIKKLRDMEEG